MSEAERITYRVALNSEPTGNVTINPFVQEKIEALPLYEESGDIRFGRESQWQLS